MQKTTKETVFRGDVVEVVRWVGVTPDSPGEEYLCQAFEANLAQVEGGPFGRVVLEGNCGGPWEPIAWFVMPCAKQLSSGMVWIRPRVEGGIATVYLIVRR